MYIIKLYILFTIKKERRRDEKEREFFTVHEPMLQKVCSYESDLGTGRGKELGDPA